jgi:hypothetical protein
VIHNIPGKSLVALVVDHAPGEPRPRTCMQSRLSSSPMSCRAQSSRKLMTRPSGSTSPAAAIRSPVTVIPAQPIAMRVS